MKTVNLFLFVALIALLAAALIGGVLRQTARGYAEGGGQLTVAPRLLSPETYSSATVNGDGVALAVQGDRNSIALSYSQQPQPTPAPEAPRRSDAGLGAFVGSLVVAVAIVGCFMYWLMASSSQAKYY